MWVGRTQQRRKQALQSSDQHVGLAAAFGQLTDLQIFRTDLSTQEFHLAFETRDIAIFGRGPSRQVGACRCGDGCVVYHNRRGDIGRGVSRQVASCRARKFGNLRDMPCDRFWRDHVLVAERGFLSQAIEMTLGAITLNGSDRAGVPGMLIANSGLVDSEGVLVGAGRGLSRRVGHLWNDTPTQRRLGSLSPALGPTLCLGVEMSGIDLEADESRMPREVSKVPKAVFSDFYSKAFFAS